MPFERFPERVGDFQKWVTTKVKKARLTDSATGGNNSTGRRRRIRKRKKKKEDD